MISADIKNFESTLSKMIKAKTNKQKKTTKAKLKIASGKPAGLILSLFFCDNETQWFTYSNTVTHAVSGPNQCEEADIVF